MRIPGVVRRLARSAYGPQTWRATIFVAQSAVVATVAFLVVLVSLVVGVPLLFVALFGLPLLWFCLVAARTSAVVDAWRFTAVLGWRLWLRPRAGSVPPGTPPDLVPGRLGRAVLRLTSPAAWLEVLYALVVLPLFGWLGAWLVFVVWGAGLSFTLFPLYGHGLADSGRFLGLDLGYPGSLLLHLGIGIAALLAAPWVARGVAVAHFAVARLVLSPSVEPDLQARVDDLEASRAGMVAAATAERRRIERDLHDGAQARLVSVAMTLGRAQERFTDDPESARGLVAEAHTEAKRALVELRDLARGIHPSVLTDRGLDAALSGLAARSPVPVTLDIEIGRRLDIATESVAYFFVAEALTNVAHHAQATQVRVGVRPAGDRLAVEVADDGRGGAREDAGTGIAGLRDRARAVDGDIVLVSPPGGGTTLRMELPWAMTGGTTGGKKR
ncbi:sensor histidine kinase [Parafrankia elaeagni]|uniref:sensor histidine kinase n=1 Tax=Parafrankia elaeagni TaxID=222534 RepID=UPI0003A72D2E|nr:sensor domain-containing protein [Parafrankia elaeagni]